MSLQTKGGLSNRQRKILGRVIKDFHKKRGRD